MEGAFSGLVLSADQRDAVIKGKGSVAKGAELANIAIKQFHRTASFPLPAVAMPGFPVVLMYISPLLPVVCVRLPL